jgi:hypothetical protein
MDIVCSAERIELRVIKLCDDVRVRNVPRVEDYVSEQRLTDIIELTAAN